MLIKAIYIHACIHNFKQLPSIDFQQDYFFDKMIKFDCYSRFPFFCEKKKTKLLDILVLHNKEMETKILQIRKELFLSI